MFFKCCPQASQFAKRVRPEFSSYPNHSRHSHHIFQKYTFCEQLTPLLQFQCTFHTQCTPQPVHAVISEIRVIITLIRKDITTQKAYSYKLQLYLTFLTLSPFACKVARPEQQTNAEELDNPALFNNNNKIMMFKMLSTDLGKYDNYD